MKENQTLPRIICDRCMKDADAFVIGSDAFSSKTLLRCHDTEELIYTERLLQKKGVQVWENLRPQFMSQEDLILMERTALEHMLTSIEELKLFHRVRRAQGAAPLYAEVDEAIDTLILFRKP